MVRNQTHNETDYYMILSSQEIGKLCELFNQANNGYWENEGEVFEKKWNALWQDIGAEQDDRTNLYNE